MHKNMAIWLSLLIGFLFISFIWQFAEPEIVEFVGKACYTITKRSFIEIDTSDEAGIPMRYYPRVGKVYDPELVAMEASRYYKTRIDPIREQKFLQLSEWLVKQVDATGLIPQTYNFPAASLKQPWYSASTQSAAMLAIAQRAGFLRNRDLLNTARAMLQQLDPQNGNLIRTESDSTLWFKSYPDYALRGMINTLLNLHDYYKLVGEPLAEDLFNRGARMLNSKMVMLEGRGYLDDRYTRMGKRQEHRQLVSLLEELNQITQNKSMNTRIARYKRLDKKLVAFQMLDQYVWSRIFGVIFAWMLCSLIIHAFLRVPK